MTDFAKKCPFMLAKGQKLWYDEGGEHMQESLPTTARAVAEVNTDALERNFRLIRSHCGGRTVAVVKADAYGHGAALAVPAFLRGGCDFFAVATLAEALAVRKLAPHADILVLGYTPPTDVALLVRHRLTQTVFSAPYAAALSAAAAHAGQLRIHLKIDGGMCRLGFSPQDTEALRAVLSLQGFLPCGVFTHLPSVTSAPNATRAALRDFCALRKELPQGLFWHAAASAAALTIPDAVLDGARVGLALYGYAPVPTVLPLAPALSLFAEVVQLRCVPAGTPVGYDGTFVCPRESRIGVLPIGYADGFSRALTGLSVTALHGGRTYPARLVGRICMDQAMVDLTDTPVTAGDRVCLFRDARPLAAQQSTIVYEVLSTLSGRIARRAVTDCEEN